MFRDMIIIYKKELQNILRDKRTLFTSFILPVFFLPLIFSVLGYITGMQEQEKKTFVYTVNIKNNKDEKFTEILRNYLSYNISGDQKTDIQLTVEFPQVFSIEKKNNVKIYYDSLKNKSVYALDQTLKALKDYQDYLINIKLAEYNLQLDDLNTIVTKTIDLAPQDAQGGNILVNILPYIILLTLFAGAMNLGMNTTAGEKERGSLASLLVNQVSRTSIAMGKILFVVTASIVNTISSFIGLIIAFSSSGSLFAGSSIALTISYLSIGKIIAFIITMLLLSGFSASIVVLIGSFARNMKEAGSYIMPVYLIILLIGISSMNLEISDNFYLYIIPVVNCIFMLKAIIINQFTIFQLAATIIFNLFLISCLIILITRLYSSEKIINTI